ncbi:hypothetical protein [Streptomyces sp. NPDC097610]|uniref:hypothetical protein n=1 Tax=Streptomyces sp. NPDC097610 TaxID=3157227 RepID=UPI003322E207
MSRGQIHHEAVEQRLRGALEARANAVDLENLRPGVPPTESRRSLLPSRRTVVVLFGLAAAVATAVFAVTERDANTPVGPARPPSVSPSPSLSPHPSPPPSAIKTASAVGVTTQEAPVPASTARPR